MIRCNNSHISPRSNRCYFTPAIWESSEVNHNSSSAFSTGVLFGRAWVETLEILEQDWLFQPICKSWQSVTLTLNIFSRRLSLRGIKMNFPSFCLSFENLVVNVNEIHHIWVQLNKLVITRLDIQRFPISLKLNIISYILWWLI